MGGGGFEGGGWGGGRGEKLGKGDVVIERLLLRASSGSIIIGGRGADVT